MRLAALDIGKGAVTMTMVLLPCLAVALSAQETFSRITRDYSEATLTVFDGRPLERAAQTLAHDYGIHVSVEDPLYLWEGDLVEVRHRADAPRLMAPKPVLLEVTFQLDARDQLADLPSLLDALIERASIDRPLGYRIDMGPGGYTIVPTRMRNENGELVAYASPLDTEVTLPQTDKPHKFHAEAIRELVEAATGYQIACCTFAITNFDLQRNVEFGVDHESARHALQRLGLLRPQPVVQHMRCQGLTLLCFVHWTPLTAARPGSPPD